MVDVTIEDVGPCRKHLKITIPKDVVKAKVEENYERLASTVIINGFRKGHVPRKLIERRFGEEVLEEVKQDLLTEASETAIEEHGLKVLGTPSFDNVEFAADQDCVCEITLEVEPEFELAEYKGLQLARGSVELSDEELERGMETVRTRRAALELQPEGSAVAANDHITCDWEITSDDETVASEKEDQFVVAGKRFGRIELEKDIAEVLEGAEFGESRQMEARILDSYQIEKWRGKDCTLSVTVKEIRRPALPELDEEFAKSLDFESLDEMKEFVRRDIQRSKERKNALDLERQIFDQFLEAMPFDLPEGVLKNQARNIMLRQQYRLRLRGIPEREIEKHLEQLRDASEEAAARNLKEFFVLGKIAEKEKIFVTENEVENRIVQMANSYHISAQRMRRKIEQEGSISELRAGMREDKTLDFLLKNAEITAEGAKIEDPEPKETV